MKPLELSAGYLKRQATAFRLRAQHTRDPAKATEYREIANWYEEAAAEAVPDEQVTRLLSSYR
jgi:hypothetical protein